MKTILIIDDEKDFCFFVKANLEFDKTCQILIANNGRDGIRSAERHKPDLILLDVMMPEMDGVQVLSQLKGSKKTMHIPVVMLTAKNDDETKLKAASRYSEDYIPKPVETTRLKEKIDSILKFYQQEG